MNENFQSTFLSRWQSYRLPLGLLTLVLLGVVYLLPENGIAPRTSRPEPQPSSVDPPQPTAVTPTPTQLREQARHQAEKAQKAVAEKLNLLSTLAAGRWAAEEFALAQQSASGGGSDYNLGRYEQAREQYDYSLLLLEELIQQAPQVFADAVAAGYRALKNNSPDNATAHFELALAIRPQDFNAQQGLEHTRLLSRVLPLLERAGALAAQGQLEQALEVYHKALALDQSRAGEIGAQVTAIRNAIVERDFSRTMEQGYAAQARFAYQQAIAAFEQALELKPGASEALAGVEQARQQQTQKQIDYLLASALHKEQQEQWQAAALDYQNALALDDSLTSSQLGSIRASFRARLDQRLEAALAQPARLTDEEARRQLLELFEEAQAIKYAGPRLQTQLEQLEQRLGE